MRRKSLLEITSLVTENSNSDVFCANTAAHASKQGAAKGSYVKSIYLSTTMSPGVQIDSKSVETK